jgi:homoserine kinase
MNKPIRIKVPATTSNMGPGFDSIGMALDIWNTVTIQLSDHPIVSIEGSGNDTLPTNEHNLVYRAAMKLLEIINQEEVNFHISCENNIPLERGLGSSAAAIVGGLSAANAITGSTVSKEKILELAVSLEGHADNAAPAVNGGVQIAIKDNDSICTFPVSISDDLNAVLYIPDLLINTTMARDILPDVVPINDVVYNLGRVALLINSLASGRFQDLCIATTDRLHQPARSNLFPQMQLLINAAMHAGSLGAFLSGSGSTVLALTQGRELTIAYEIAEAAKKANLPGEVKITSLSLRGVYLEGSN